MSGLGVGFGCRVWGQALFRQVCRVWGQVKKKQNSNRPVTKDDKCGSLGTGLNRTELSQTDLSLKVPNGTFVTGTKVPK